MDQRLLIENLATIIATTLLLGAVALGPVGRALARRIEGKRHPVDDDQLRDELAATQARLLELEERVEFNERLLTRASAEPRQGEPA